MNNNFFNKAYLNYIRLKRNFDNDSKNNINSLNNVNIIGYYDNNSKIWYNAWAIYASDNDTILKYSKSKETLKYALNIEKDMTSIDFPQRIIIKSCLINSKYYINESIQLDIIIAIIMYLNKATRLNITKLNNIDCYEMEV